MKTKTWLLASIVGLAVIPTVATSCSDASGPSNTGASNGTSTGSSSGSSSGNSSGGGSAPTCGDVLQACCAGQNCNEGLICEANVCAQKPIGEYGKTCSKNSDCMSGLCLPLGNGTNVCTEACPQGTNCPPGWTCDPLIGQPSNVCQCAMSNEQCNGKDDDCNGIVDDKAAVDAVCLASNGVNYVCTAGACACTFTMCGTSCTDIEKDSQNCGTCGNVCSLGTICNAGVCDCIGCSLPECAGTVEAIFAIKWMSLGSLNFDGTSNPTSGWKQYGFNLDGRVSTNLSLDLCKPAAGGSPAAVYPDGNDGIDNSFGKNVLPLLLTLDSKLDVVNNAEILAGKQTLLLTVKGLDALASCSTSSKLYRGVNLGFAPLFDGTDAWPIDPTFLNNPADPSSATNHFFSSWIKDGRYGSGPEANFNLVVKAGSGLFAIPIRHAQIEMLLDPNNAGATSGQLGGIIDTEAFIASFSKFIAGFDVTLCDPNSPTLLNIQNQLRQASDIMIDGSQDATKDCNGISIGIGFTMKLAKLGLVAPPEVPPQDPCTP